MKTSDELLAIAEQIAGDSVGAWTFAEIDEEQVLTTEEHAEVMILVYEQIDNCGACGWVEWLDNLEESIETDEGVCWRCAQSEREELEALEEEKELEALEEEENE